MNLPTIAIVHKLPNRIRMKISHPFINLEEIQQNIHKTDGIKFFSYNKYIKSVIVNFDNKVIKVEEIVSKIAVYLSRQYDFSPIRFVSDCARYDMPLLSYYALITIAGANFLKIFKPLENIQEFFNWLSLGTTIGAVSEHAYIELNDKGTIDPEVMSIMYLMNSIGKGNMLSASLITWITTFGRHLLKSSYDSVVLNIHPIKRACSDELCYNISIVENIKVNKDMTKFKEFIFKMIDIQQASISSASQNMLCYRTNIDNKISIKRCNNVILDKNN